MFDAGVLAVAVGSPAVLAGLARARLVRLRGTAVTLMAAWSACLRSSSPSRRSTGRSGRRPRATCRYASPLAFLCLPVAGALALGRAWRTDALGPVRDRHLLVGRGGAGLARPDPAGLRAASPDRRAVVAVRAAGVVRAGAALTEVVPGRRDGDGRPAPAWSALARLRLGVEQVQEVRAGDGGERCSDQPGQPRREHEADREAGGDPDVQAERAGDQLADRVP